MTFADDSLLSPLGHFGVVKNVFANNADSYETKAVSIVFLVSC